MEGKKWIAGVVLVLVFLLFGAHVEAGDSYVNGTVYSITSIPAGLLVMLDTGIPTSCAGTPYGWMIIPEGDKTMVAVTMMAYLNKDKVLTLYTDGSFHEGFCRINQAHLYP